MKCRLGSSVAVAIVYLAAIVLSLANAQCPTYTVQSGDTFSSIASKYSTTASALQSANSGVSATNLQIGQKINIPCSSGSNSGSSSSTPAASSSSGGVTVGSSQFQQALTTNGYPAPADSVRQDMLNAIQTLGGSAVISSNRELAMFIAQAIHETGGFQHLSETNGAQQSYAPFYGRGYLQLTGQSNYQAASQAILGNAQTLVSNPNQVATSDSLAWETAAWFWKTNVHSVVQGGSFGASTKKINSMECGGGNAAEAQDRCNVYTKILPIISSGSTADCSGC